jgi:hypothetical protein
LRSICLGVAKCGDVLHQFGPLWSLVKSPHIKGEAWKQVEHAWHHVSAVVR